MPQRTGILHPAEQGTALLTAIGDATVISAPGAGKNLYVTHVVICVYATGTGAIAALEDGAGGTKFAVIDASETGVHSLDFGPRGYKLSENTALNLTVETANASVRCTAIAYKADKNY